MARKINKDSNSFGFQITEGEEIKVLVGDAPNEDAVVLIAPYDGFLNCYMKREVASIHYKD